MAEGVGWFDGAAEVTRCAIVASISYLLGNVAVHRIADHRVENVSGHEPCDHEDAKSDVACELVVEIFEHFRQLKRNSGSVAVKH